MRRKQTKSSTESGIVANSDYLAHTVWLPGFMKDQIRKLLYQNNMNAIQIENNGSVLSVKKIRTHQHKILFIKDILKRENIEVKHCLTEQIIADCFTKPLQR